MMTQGTRKQTIEPILGSPILRTAILGTHQLQPVEWEGVAYCSSVGISSNIPRLLSSNLLVPRVIDRSNLSSRRFAAR